MRESATGTGGTVDRSGLKRKSRKKRAIAGGAKAYAPFGAGRETGHQEPAVAAKREEEKTLDVDAALRTKP